MQASLNGRIPRNKVIPVQILEGRKQDVDEVDERKEITAENGWQSAIQKMAPHSGRPLSNPVEENSRKLSPMLLVTQAKVNAVKWRRVAKKRNEKKNLKQYEKVRSSFSKGIDQYRTCQMKTAQLSDIEDFADDNENRFDDKRKKQKTSINSPSRALIYYFAKLACSDDEQVIDLDFVETLINNGASPNICDRHGQSILHEAARQWELTVVKFLLEKGARIDQADKTGRTPLHVAAAVDYPEMVKYLVETGANVHARTTGELQTPIHFAARNDAVNSLKMLIKCGANISDLDYKNRSPLHVAAELDRSETARYLIEQGADAGAVDDSGMTALVLMITKMPSVAKEALNQFYSFDRANRKQYFYLNYLEPPVPTCMSSGCAKTAMEVVIQHKQFELIMHPVFQRLIKVKWAQFAKKGAWSQVIVSLVFVILWTILGVLTPNKESELYSPITRKWWRVVLGVMAVLLTFNEIRRELVEYFFSKKEHRLWIKWREDEIQRDLQFCHPRWPGERAYLMQEIDSLKQQEPSYFIDLWNYFDWLAYFMILLCIITHFLAVFKQFSMALIVHVNIFSATLILLWIRMLKYARAFTALGPFVVMISHVILDTLKFAFLYFVFYIPYAASFWMIFGQRQQVKGYSNVNDLFYSMIRMTVVDEYNYDALTAVEPFMSKLLCGTYIAFSAIVCLNLFIALMSDTFQRVYDNVKANAVMQQASTILTLENNLSVARRRRFTNHIYTRCSPEELYYDDDIDDDAESDMKKMTHQIKGEVDQIHELLKDGTHGHSITKRADSPSGNRSELKAVRGEMKRLEQQQRAFIAQFHTQIAEVKELIQKRATEVNRKKQKQTQSNQTNRLADPEC